MDASGGETRSQCCKEQYCTQTWDVRSINQRKLDVVKQEMARVNINILGISELTWRQVWVNLILMTMICTTVDKNPFTEWSRPHSQQASPKRSTWAQFQKQHDLGSFLRQTIQRHSNPSPCPNH